jgi:hypothetical protein
VIDYLKIALIKAKQRQSCFSIKVLKTSRFKFTVREIGEKGGIAVLGRLGSEMVR